jgi:hypothetical protein
VGEGVLAHSAGQIDPMFEAVQKMRLLRMATPKSNSRCAKYINSKADSRVYTDSFSKLIAQDGVRSLRFLNNSINSHCCQLTMLTNAKLQF